MSNARYAELQCTSHFSFLRGASSCEELFAQGAMLGIEALAVVDLRAHEAAKTTGVRLIIEQTKQGNMADAFPAPLGIWSVQAAMGSPDCEPPNGEPQAQARRR